MPRSKSGQSSLGLLLICALAFSSGVAGANRSASSDPEAKREPAASGHARMIAELASIANSAAEWNPYVLGRQLLELRQEVAALPETATEAEKLSAQSVLGLQEFLRGSLSEAIRLFSSVHEQLPETATIQRSQVAFFLGLSHLRRGERQNCVANHTADSCILPIRGRGIHTLKEGSRTAIRYFREVLSLTPAKTVEHVAAKWLLNIAYMTLGEYPDGVPEDELIPTEIFSSSVDFPRLLDVAPDLGVNVFDQAGGAVVEDLNGDGFLDILTSTLDPAGSMHYLESTGDGGFVERTREANLTGLTGGLNMVHADYDNDGDSDILVLRGAWLEERGRHPNSLLRNDGSGRFTDVTFAAGLGDRHYPTQTAAWADYDNDGDLDLYVGNEDNDYGFPGQLFRNNGDGTFTDVAKQAGVENNRYAKSVAWGDYDGDRYPDLYVSNYHSDNRLYRNNRDGTFTDVARDLGVTLPLASFVSWFWDFDNDGALDLFVTSYPYQSNQVPLNLFLVVASYLGIPLSAERARLYQGDGQGEFTEVGAEQGLEQTTMPMGANLGDLDNDGFLDFYLGTGYPEYSGLMPNVLFWNRGGQRFTDVTMAAGMGHLQKGHGVAFADLDNDGDQDLFEQMGGFFPDDGYANVLFENPGFGNNWLKIKLVGVRSNRAAIGARLQVTIVEDGVTRHIYRHVNTSGSFGSNPLIQHLGLGGAEEVSRLEVYWPTSDSSQIFRQVAAGQTIEITEGDDTFRHLPNRRVRFRTAGSQQH